MTSFFNKLIYHYNQPWFNFILTIIINFKLLPLKFAIKFPIYIYGKVNIYWLNGKIKLDMPSENIYSGMIKFGKNNEFFNGVDNSSFISMESNSIIIFKGPCTFSNNYKIRISENAQLTLGEYVFFGSSIRIICTKNIFIGKYSRCAYETQIIDSNFHYMYNENNSSISRRDGCIIIGDYAWIGNRCSINKGTILPNYTTICQSSITNKDYTNIIKEKSIIGGCPAVLIQNKIKRIYSTQIENMITNYFNSKPFDSILIIENINDNLEDIEFWFKKIM